MNPPEGTRCLSLSLTQSLRFGAPVAELANVYLRNCLQFAGPPFKEPVLGTLRNY